GCLPSEVPDLLAHAEPMHYVEVCGLMGMAKFTDNEEDIHSSFRLLANTLNQNKVQYPKLCELSMGMSNDYIIAIEEGATMLRIGSAIFGGR
ncbi:MAG: YggS family pyridoxal phosphate-dependent enzyme, partial [Bacteroidetes bacterium]|nr:YggS family pyridoxal phosphate-dependent enzyme [Bacteroidota bacterium]